MNSSDCGGIMAVHRLFIDFKKACDLVRREVLYNILIVWGTYAID
jgi:hypothetical protein